MKFPSDIEKIILSYLTYNEIKTLSLPYDYYKNYLQNHKSKTKKEAWYRGNYNNINQSCFTCNNSFIDKPRVMVICMDCELMFHEVCNYPLVCFDCVKSREKIKRGKVFGSFCPSCNKKKMVVAIECYS